LRCPILTSYKILASGPIDLDEVRRVVEENCERVAKLGNWPSYIPPQSLLGRIPSPDRPAEGFDAGLACALGLLPLEHQAMAAGLHAAYTEALVAQIRAEAPPAERPIGYSTSTIWWLAACSVCREENLDEVEFSKQLVEFGDLMTRKGDRWRRAVAQFEAMVSNFELCHSPGVLHEYAAGRAGGAIQGAYISGHDYGVWINGSQEPELTFIGTFRPTLGLEDFEWADPDRPKSEADPEGYQGRSGGVHGSRQFVKCTDSQEASRALRVVQETLGCHRGPDCKGC
jgi:hypothetical protein